MTIIRIFKNLTPGVESSSVDVEIAHIFDPQLHCACLVIEFFSDIWENESQIVCVALHWVALAVECKEVKGVGRVVFPHEFLAFPD